MLNSSGAYTELLRIMNDSYSLGTHPFGGKYIELPGNGFHRVCLYEYEKAPQNTFSLMIFAGDTCKQARDLYKHFSPAKALELKNLGWTLRSNFHFAWQRKNIFDTKCDKVLDLSEYIDYWRRALSNGYIRKYNKAEFNLLLNRMRNARVMDDRDIADFHEYFKTRHYQSVITCPGIINRISYPKERLNEGFEVLANELKERMLALVGIYRS